MNNKELKELNINVGFAHRYLNKAPNFKRVEIESDFKVCKAKYDNNDANKYRMFDLMSSQADKIGALLVYENYGSFDGLIVYLYSDNIYKMEDFRIVDGFIYCRLSKVTLSKKEKEAYVLKSKTQRTKRSPFSITFEEASDELQLFPF